MDDEMQNPAITRDTLTEDLKRLPEKKLLDLWEQTQRIAFLVQKALTPGMQVGSGMEDQIIMELLRRSLLPGHHAAPCTSDEQPAGKDAARL